MLLKSYYNPVWLFKIGILTLWVVFFVLLLKRDYMVESLDLKELEVLARSNEESFLGVYFKGQRIGYVQNRFSQNDSGDIHLEQNAYILLRILNENHPVHLTGKAVLTPEYLLKDFDFSLEAPFYRMDIQGEVMGDTVVLEMNTGKQKSVDRIKLANPPFLSTSRRAYLLSRSPEKGDKLKIPYFDPFTLTVQNTIVEYEGMEKTLVSGRIHNLHHFTENYAGIRVNSWLNDEGDVVKEESPAGFIFISEPEFRAKDISRTAKEVLSAVSVPIIGKLPDLKNTEQIRYRLKLPENSEFVLDKDRQSFDGEILTMTREKIPLENSAACLSGEENLVATTFVQSDHPQIVSLNDSLKVKEMPFLLRIRKVAAWVYDNLEKKPVIGIPDAVTTLANRRGDCNEHAALFAALARNAGIPTRIAAGVTFHQGAFYYHAWNEVCINNTWISLDTTTNQFPADLGHLKFVEGELAEQVKIGALLGKLEIEVVK